jgi:hypothetical protein
MMHPPRRLRVLAVAAVVLAAGALAACTQRSPDMSDQPSIDVVVAKYDRLAAGIREAVSAEYPDAQWTEQRPADQSFGDADGEVRALSPVWAATVPIADDEAARDRVVAAADDVLRAEQIDAFAVVTAEPGRFEYVAGDGWGGRFHLTGGSTNVVVSYETGSHPKG